MAEAFSFIVADDHPMVRDALESAIGQAFAGSRIVGAATLGEVQRALDLDPDVDALLLDLDMPGMDGLTGVAVLRSEHPTVPIIVVSALREPSVQRRVHELGASAYIEKSASLTQIAKTVRAVLNGEIFSPPAGTEAHSSFAQRAAQLTPQQWRVLALMVQGDQNKQIAHKLGVGEATVKAHVTEILRKLGVRSRTQAVIEARALELPTA
jgi:DNA-binding NarL/FixJ family response regulator